MFHSWLKTGVNAMERDGDERMPRDITPEEIDALFCSIATRRMKRDTELKDCMRRDIHDIDFRYFGVNWVWKTLCDDTLALVQQSHILEVHFGITLSPIWRWQDCDGHVLTESVITERRPGDPMRCHKDRFDRMYPLTVEWSEPIMVMEEDQIGRAHAHSWKCANSRVYHQGTLYHGAKYFLYMCVKLDYSQL